MDDQKELHEALDEFEDELVLLSSPYAERRRDLSFVAVERCTSIACLPVLELKPQLVDIILSLLAQDSNVAVVANVAKVLVTLCCGSTDITAGKDTYVHWTSVGVLKTNMLSLWSHRRVIFGVLTDRLFALLTANDSKRQSKLRSRSDGSGRLMGSSEACLWSSLAQILVCFCSFVHSADCELLGLPQTCDKWDSLWSTDCGSSKKSLRQTLDELTQRIVSNDPVSATIAASRAGALASSFNAVCWWTLNLCLCVESTDKGLTQPRPLASLHQLALSSLQRCVRDRDPVTALEASLWACHAVTLIKATMDRYSSAISRQFRTATASACGGLFGALIQAVAANRYSAVSTTSHRSATYSTNRGSAGAFECQAMWRTAFEIILQVCLQHHAIPILLRIMSEGVLEAQTLLDPSCDKSKHILEPLWHPHSDPTGWLEAAVKHLVSDVLEYYLIFHGHDGVKGRLNTRQITRLFLHAVVQWCAGGALSHDTESSRAFVRRVCLLLLDYYKRPDCLLEFKDVFVSARDMWISQQQTHEDGSIESVDRARGIQAAFDLGLCIMQWWWRCLAHAIGVSPQVLLHLSHRAQQTVSTNAKDADAFAPLLLPRPPLTDGSKGTESTPSLAPSTTISRSSSKAATRSTPSSPDPQFQTRHSMHAQSCGDLQDERVLSPVGSAGWSDKESPASAPLEDTSCRAQSAAAMRSTIHSSLQQQHTPRIPRPSLRQSAAQQAQKQRFPYPLPPPGAPTDSHVVPTAPTHSRPVSARIRRGVAGAAAPQAGVLVDGAHVHRSMSLRERRGLLNNRARRLLQLHGREVSQQPHKAPLQQSQHQAHERKETTRLQSAQTDAASSVYSWPQSGLRRLFSDEELEDMTESGLRSYHVMDETHINGLLSCLSEFTADVEECLALLRVVCAQEHQRERQSLRLDAHVQLLSFFRAVL